MSDVIFWFVLAPLTFAVGMFLGNYAVNRGWSFLQIVALAVGVGFGFYVFYTALFNVIGAPS